MLDQILRDVHHKGTKSQRAANENLDSVIGILSFVPL